MCGLRHGQHQKQQHQPEPTPLSRPCKQPKRLPSNLPQHPGAAPSPPPLTSDCSRSTRGWHASPPSRKRRSKACPATAAASPLRDYHPLPLGPGRGWTAASPTRKAQLAPQRPVVLGEAAAANGCQGGAAAAAEGEGATQKIEALSIIVCITECWFPTERIQSITRLYGVAMKATPFCARRGFLGFSIPSVNTRTFTLGNCCASWERNYRKNTSDPASIPSKTCADHSILLVVLLAVHAPPKDLTVVKTANKPKISSRCPVFAPTCPDKPTHLDK